MAAVPYARRSFAGGAISTTIPTGMGSGDTSFTVAAATGWSFANDFYVVVDRGLSSEEKILCSGIASLVVSVASGGRGADGTSAQAHVAGCTVQVCHVAQDDDEANQVVAAVLGQSGAAKGDILFMESAAGPNTLMRLPIGSTGNVLGVSAGVPAWGAVPSPTLGGVGSIFGATGQLVAGSGASTGVLLSAGSTGQVLTAGGTAASGLIWSVPSVSLISSTVLGATAATISMTGIPGTYNHLRVVCVLRSTKAAETDSVKVQFNGDTNAHYDYVVIGLNSGSLAEQSQQAETFLGANMTIPAGSATAGVASRYVIDIPFYAGTTFYKTARIDNGWNDGATGTTPGTDFTTDTQDGTWRSTTAITSIVLGLLSGPAFVTGSSVILYGIT